MIKFRVLFGEIQECEVIKETEKQLTFINYKGVAIKENKRGSDCSWHESKHDAKECVISECNAIISKLNRQIECEVNRRTVIEQL